MKLPQTNFQYTSNTPQTANDSNSKKLFNSKIVHWAYTPFLDNKVGDELNSNKSTVGRVDNSTFLAFPRVTSTGAPGTGSEGYIIYSQSFDESYPITETQVKTLDDNGIITGIPVFDFLGVTDSDGNKIADNLEFKTGSGTSDSQTPQNFKNTKIRFHKFFNAPSQPDILIKQLKISLSTDMGSTFSTNANLTLSFDMSTTDPVKFLSSDFASISFWDMPENTFRYMNTADTQVTNTGTIPGENSTDNLLLKSKRAFLGYRPDTQGTYQILTEFDPTQTTIGQFKGPTFLSFPRVTSNGASGTGSEGNITYSQSTTSGTYPITKAVVDALSTTPSGIPAYDFYGVFDTDGNKLGSDIAFTTTAGKTLKPSDYANTKLRFNPFYSAGAAKWVTTGSPAWQITSGEINLTFSDIPEGGWWSGTDIYQKGSRNSLSKMHDGYGFMLSIAEYLFDWPAFGNKDLTPFTLKEGGSATTLGDYKKLAVDGGSKYLKVVRMTSLTQSGDLSAWVLDSFNRTSETMVVLTSYADSQKTVGEPGSTYRLYVSSSSSVNFHDNTNYPLNNNSDAQKNYNDTVHQKWDTATGGDGHAYLDMEYIRTTTQVQNNQKGVFRITGGKLKHGSDTYNFVTAPSLTLNNKISLDISTDNGSNWKSLALEYGTDGANSKLIHKKIWNSSLWQPQTFSQIQPTLNLVGIEENKFIIKQYNAATEAFTTIQKTAVTAETFTNILKIIKEGKGTSIRFTNAAWIKISSYINTEYKP